MDPSLVLPSELAGDSPDFRAEFRQGFRKAIPLAVAVFGFGVSFGIVARTAELGALAPIVMSATTFAGSAQFAAASVMSTGGAVAAAIVAAILLNSRYLPIGISVAPVMSGSVWRRFLSAQLVVDESWAVGHLGAGRYSRGRLMGAGVLVYAGWVLGTVVGVFGAQFLSNPEDLGLDVVSPVLFLALLVGQITNRRALLAAVLGTTIALTLVPLTSPGIPLVAASAACLIGLVPR